jgi:hypothetical protein
MARAAFSSYGFDSPSSRQSKPPDKQTISRDLVLACKPHQKIEDVKSQVNAIGFHLLLPGEVVSGNCITTNVTASEQLMHYVWPYFTTTAL